MPIPKDRPMFSIEKLENKILLSVFTQDAGNPWERHMFDTMDDLEVFCHQTGISIPMVDA